MGVAVHDEMAVRAELVEANRLRKRLLSLESRQESSNEALGSLEILDGNIRSLCGIEERVRMVKRFSSRMLRDLQAS